MAVEVLGKESSQVQVVAKNVSYMLQDNADYSYVRNIALQDIEKQYYENQLDEQEEINDMIENGEIESEDEYDRVYEGDFDPVKYATKLDELTNKYMLNVTDLPKDVVVVVDRALSENEDAIKAAIYDKLGVKVSQIEKYGNADKKDIVQQQAYEAIGDMYKSDDYRKYLDLTSNMNGYSLRNTALVIAQYPDAEAVKGFKAWKEFDRGVAKGESGNAIFCPAMKSLTSEKQVDTYMKSHAFDYGGQNSIRYTKERNRLIDKINEDGKVDVMSGYFVSYVWDIKQTQCLSEKDNTEELLNALRFKRPLQNNLDNYSDVKACIEDAMGIDKGSLTTYSNLSEQENLYKAIEAYAEETFRLNPDKITGIKTAEPSQENIHKMETMMSAYLVSKHIGIECDEKMAFELGGVLKDRLSNDAIRIGRREMFKEAYERATKFSKDFNKAFDKAFAPYEKQYEKQQEKQITEEDKSIPAPPTIINPQITITCNFSESNAFKSGKTYSVSEFDAIMRKADTAYCDNKKYVKDNYGDYRAEAFLNKVESEAKHNVSETVHSGKVTTFDEELHSHKDYEEYKKVLSSFGYDKVDFTIKFPNGNELRDRQDIGDGHGGVIDFLSVCDMKKEALQLTEQALSELNAKIQNVKDMAAAEELKQQREHLQQIKPVLKEDISKSKTKHKNDAQKE